MTDRQPQIDALIAIFDSDAIKSVVVGQPYNDATRDRLFAMVRSRALILDELIEHGMCDE